MTTHRVFNATINCAVRVLRLYIRYSPIRKGKDRLFDLVRWAVKPRTAIFQPRTIRTVQGIRMRVDMTDLIQRHIYFWGQWEPDETWLLGQVLREGDAFIDIGANLGYFTLLGSHLVGRGGVVFAFDPSPQIRDRLQTNVALNECGNIRILPYAVSDKSGQALFFQHNVNPGQNSLRSLGEQAAGVVKVETVTLDELLPAGVAVRARLVKMDIEGAELLALHGMKGLLSRENGPDVVCEITDSFLRPLGGSEADLLSYMKSLGYSGFLVENRRLIPFDASPGQEQYTAFFTKRVDEAACLIDRELVGSVGSG